MNRRIALAIVGGVIAAFGAVALIATFINSRGAEATAWIFFLVSLAFVVAGGYLAVYNLRTNAADNQLKETGLIYDAIITSIDREIKSSITGSTTYTLTATGTRGDDTRAFTKEYPGVRPFFDVGQAVQIYVDPNNPKRFVIG